MPTPATAFEPKEDLKVGGIAWGPALFVLVSHAAAIVGPLLYGIYHGFTLAAILIGVAFLFITMFAVGAGYHRCYSHGAYEARLILRVFFITFGSAAFEGSVLKWVALHRRHHAGSDTEDDPHNINRGFWWAHMGWVLHQYTPTKITPNIDDLERDPLLKFQDRYYALFAIVFGVFLPWGIGWFFGDPWGGLTIGCFLRIIVLHHITWLVNSMAHSVGSRPYSMKTSARDSFWTALFTLGEGYHNYHHAFPWDYRNGVKLFSYDPTKWAIYLMSRVGLVKNLIRVPKETVASSS